MSHKTILKAGASMLMLAAVSACGDSDDIDVPDPIITPSPAPTPAPTPTPTPTTGTVEELFGSAFAAIFNRDPTLDPVEVDPGDVPPLAPASDPEPLEDLSTS